MQSSPLRKATEPLVLSYDLPSFRFQQHLHGIMVNSTANQRQPVEVIDLVSDDDNTDGPTMEPPRSNMVIELEPDSDVDSTGDHTPSLQGHTPAVDLLDAALDIGVPEQNGAGGGTFINIDGEEVFIPDEDEELEEVCQAGTANANPDIARDQDIALALDNDSTFTADDCLQRVLQLFPDIEHEYVYNLYNDFDREGDYEILPGVARLDNIIEQLVTSVSYPKQESGKQAVKRKRQESLDENDPKKWERQDRVQYPYHLKGPVGAILKADFPDIPIQYITNTLGTEKYLYQAYVALAKAKDNSEGSARPYGKGRPSTKNFADASTIATNCAWPELLEELHAARERVSAIRADCAAADAKKRAEQENLQKAIAAGETAECSACYDDLPMNRQIHCNGLVAHFTCFGCAEMYIKSEVGDSRCRVLCPAGCGEAFAHQQLNLLSNKQLLNKLAQLQQEKDIRDAGLDDLEECPFCDYKAIMPPIEEDFEFHCANPDCEKISCRRCKCVSHIPISCEQHAKENKINSRHKIEEAMTAALIRSCNKCKKQFIKEFGCNKMTCPSCGNLQCYVCSVTLQNYNHFDQNPPGSRVTAGAQSKLCPLYDNVEERHEREVKDAEAAARAQVVEENPDVTPEDLEIKVSDAVKKATADRIRVAGGGAPAFPGPPLRLPRHLFRVLGGDGNNDDEDADVEAEMEAILGRELLRHGRFGAGGELPQAARLHRRADGRPHDGALDANRQQQVYEIGRRLERIRGVAQHTGIVNFQPRPRPQPAFRIPPAPPAAPFPAVSGPQPAYNAFPQPPAGQYYGPMNQAPVPGPNVTGGYGFGGGVYANGVNHNHYRPVYVPHPYPAPAPAQVGEPQANQAFDPGRRQQRQNFQQLEMLRQRHEQAVRDRDQQRYDQDQLLQLQQLEQEVRNYRRNI